MLLAGITKVVVELVAFANSMVTPAVSQVHLSKTFFDFSLDFSIVSSFAYPSLTAMPDEMLS